LYLFQEIKRKIEQAVFLLFDAILFPKREKHDAKKNKCILYGEDAKRM